MITVTPSGRFTVAKVVDEDIGEFVTVEVIGRDVDRVPVPDVGLNLELDVGRVTGGADLTIVEVGGEVLQDDLECLRFFKTVSGAYIIFTAVAKIDDLSA
ncbi:hypothetical protein C8039_07465 [Halogeometricum sp. wsp3]|nr:hypothetical protein C8039_07465 [Halogeometricum sp. wsp3]